MAIHKASLSSRKTLLALATASGLGIAAQAVVAAQLEEVVVTAQKRSQGMQDVSASIAALSGADLAETGTDSFADYFSSVPSLTMVEQGPGLSTLAIRGITTGGVRNDEPQNKETVGVYIDETPIAINGFNPDLGLYDIQRVEVLRGPQGTLYGSGSLGGTIRIITNKPNFDTLEGSAELTGSHTREGGANSGLKGAINLPLVDDRVALRAVAYRSDYDGYLDNTATGKDNANTQLTEGARLQLGAQITDRLDLNLSYMLHQLETGARSEQTGDYSFATRAFDGLDDENNIFNLTLNYAFDGATLTSSTSYLDKETVNRNSLEHLLSQALGYESDAVLEDTTEVQDFSQELRVASAGGGPLNWVAGVFYQDRSRDYTQLGAVPGIDDYLGVPATALGAPGADMAFYGTQNIEQEQRAVFGEISYEFLPSLTATIGLRYFEFEEDYDTYSSGVFNNGADSSDGSLKEDGVTPKFNLSYAVNDDSLVYLQVAEGFRLGGVNTTVPTDLCAADLAALGEGTNPDDFASDSVWNYEIGSKNEFMDRRLTVNGSVYYVDWEDMQTTLSLPGCSFSFRTNAGSARSMGLELESRFAATDALEVYGSLGLTDARLKEDVMFSDWEKGDRAPGVPALQVSAGMRYGFELFQYDDAYLRMDYRYTGESDTRFDTAAAVNRSFGDYHVLDLRAGLRIPNTPAEIALFVKNAADSDGKVYAGAESSSAPERFITIRPRTIGLTLSTQF
ncbi:TonB-dependent receptor [Parahaliea mediterranea]|uniref:TonB-dependent receptor n=1 Tax=Parahaliea mediterranea TaxID=651086 RepID=A0A939DDW7_9GAMM|nr:TonB-dependent receptor [Parahaliea mediterranea]MBN7796091.1 TonB-dependent receptor [Parahaliea mediterranea]